MRNVLTLGILLVAASMAGWFTINRDGERTTIEIDRAEIREDTRRAIDRGRDYLERTEQGQAQTGQQLQYDPTSRQWYQPTAQVGYDYVEGYPNQQSVGPQPNYPTPQSQNWQQPPTDPYSVPQPGYGPAPQYVPNEQIARQPEWQPQPPPPNYDPRYRQP